MKTLINILLVCLMIAAIALAIWDAIPGVVKAIIIIAVLWALLKKLASK